MKDISLKMDEYLPLRDVVFNTLRNAILTGELSPGERLMEIKLADKLGVSRTPIREAIRKLELEGLVVNTPRKGAEVANISPEDLRDVLEVRRSLEVLAITLACEKMTEETSAQMLNNFVENSTYNQIGEFAEKFAEKLGIVLDGRMITIKSDIVCKSRAYATIEDVEDFVSTHFDCVSHGTWRTLAEVSVSEREAQKRRRRNRPVGDTMTDDDVRKYTEAYFAAEEM